MVRVPRTISLSKSVNDELLDELDPMLAGERAAFAKRCHDRSISMAHLHVMTLLEAHGPLPMSRLAELLGSGLPTATGLVTRMEERGLVTRAHDADDRRVVSLHLTPAGADELRQLQASRRQRMATALTHLSESEQLNLLAAIRSLRSAISQLPEQGALSRD
jgi:DNA-binding MarR family transcriptional regulator